MISPDEMNHSRKEFWDEAHENFVTPHFRLQKSARLINKMASSGWYTLLDVGCARAALKPLLRPNIDYFGIDIAISRPAPNLREVDLLASPIEFDGRHFDFVVAQGLFEYLEGVQEDKFREYCATSESAWTFHRDVRELRPPPALDLLGIYQRTKSGGVPLEP